MGKAATHIMHVAPMAKRCWVHPKIIFFKPKSRILVGLHPENLSQAPSDEVGEEEEDDTRVEDEVEVEVEEGATDYTHESEAPQ
jgi:hypothetical protein